MEMDRQTLTVLFGVIIALTLFGSFYLSAPPAADEVRPVYAEGDIRNKLHQEAEKQKKKNKGKKPAPAQSSSRDGGSDDEAAEEPEAEEPTAEEPSID